MFDINSNEFDKCRDWIDERYRENHSWDTIKYVFKNDEAELIKQIEEIKLMLGWPKSLNYEIWNEIVEAKRRFYEKRKEIDEALVVSNNIKDNGTMVPTSSNSTWIRYKKHLEKNGWKEITLKNLENSCYSILKNLTPDTSKTKNRKGLVVGQVQSGKTANMAGLMAMAADNRWNMFIILSGTIEKLREQTRDRLKADFSTRKNNLHWEHIDNPGHRTNSKTLSELSLYEESNIRYFSVVLKHSTCLQNLINWLRSDLNKYKQMRIVVIDDEADQASINTKDINKDERTKINELIVKLVEEHAIGKKSFDIKAKAMNYISYTATPYANVLNESSESSLYPKDFIVSLPPSNEYIGSQHIFGTKDLSRDGEYLENDGFNIIRKIDEIDHERIKDINKSKANDIPESLKDSIAWFLCGVATMRYWNYKKPVSMLVHTSHRTRDHELVSNLIERWFSSTTLENMIIRCKTLWEKEIELFNKNKFKESYPDYGNDFDTIKDFPKFEEIKDHIKSLHGQLTRISLNEDDRLVYNEGIHLCIDNSDNKDGIDYEGDHIRLAYPNENDEYPKDTALAFLVIGGNTLSRGLTIQGLISTYFLRGTCQADSLMQMGRWFGYRKGYETIPRIWMTDDTKNKFKFLAKLEDELREELRRFSDGTQSPSDFGPRVKNSPRYSWLKITAPNKSQDAMTVDMDFTGSNIQTVLFDNNSEFFENNIKSLEKLLDKLDNPEVSIFGNSLVWRNICFKDYIEEFIKDYKYQSRTMIANQKEKFIEWVEDAYKENLIDDWNIVVSGNGKVNQNESENTWKVSGYNIGKVTRTKLKDSELKSILNIGALRAPKDMLADIPQDYKELKNKNKLSENAVIEENRKKAGIESNPLLVIYRIDKDSKAKDNSDLREDLQAVEDIIGIYINIPGKKRKASGKALVVRMDSKNVDTDDTWSEEE